VINRNAGVNISIISYGSTTVAIEEALGNLTQKGYKIDHLRIRSLPVSHEVMEFTRAHERNYVVELNRDGQLHQILRLEIPDCSMKLISLSHLDGLPLAAKWVEDQIMAKEE
jgi:2-oxoglutarate ferredoxin oxidoreductase subunit alpha